MGRSTTPTFVARTTDQTGTHVVAWNFKTYGKPTDAKAEAFRTKLNESFQPGGVNEHCLTREGAIIHTSKVEVVRQANNEIVAQATMPTFEAA